MTILETICGNGEILSPLLLHKGRDTLLSRYKPANVPAFYYRSLENGLLSSETAIEWLE